MALNADQLRAELNPLLDGAGFLSASEVSDHYRRDWFGATGDPIAVVRPHSPAAVASIMTRLHRLKQPVAVQGGMTGLAQGGVPQSGEVVLSLERLRTIERLDETAGTAIVQAGTPLQALQEAAEKVDLFFPVDTGARGTATVGGMVATNAGGNRVLRYGMMRNSVLGLEVVLPDGAVVSRLSGLVKDNAGYDLKQLFIGSEGTLGIVTRICVQLQPRPSSHETALVSVRSFQGVISLLRTLRQALGPKLGSFEVMWPNYHRFVTGQLGIGRAPFDGRGDLLVLVEALGFGGRDVADELAAAIALFLEDAPGADAVIAKSMADTGSFWRIREASGEAARAISPAVGFDVSLPIASMEAWVRDMAHELAAIGLSKLQCYGHVGDGNLHLVVGYLENEPGQKDAATEIVHRSIGALGGSISAEHGIGLSKKKHLHLTRSKAEITLMRQIKQALDPAGILNRGRIFDMGETA